MEKLLMLSLLMEEYEKVNPNDKLPESFHLLNDDEKLDIIKNKLINFDKEYRISNYSINSKLDIPSNIYLDKNALKHLEKINKNNNYKHLIKKIQEMLYFVSENPLDIYAARQRGWRIEKLSTSKNKTVFSIRLSEGDRFTYQVEDGVVTVLGLLGHYVGVTYAYFDVDFENLIYNTQQFYAKKISYKELSEKYKDMLMVPKFKNCVEFLDKNNLLELKKNIESKDFNPDDIFLIEYLTDKEKISLLKEDLLELYEYYNSKDEDIEEKDVEVNLTQNKH